MLALRESVSHNEARHGSPQGFFFFLAHAFCYPGPGEQQRTNFSSKSKHTSCDGEPHKLSGTPLCFPTAGLTTNFASEPFFVPLFLRGLYSARRLRSFHAGDKWRSTFHEMALTIPAVCSTFVLYQAKSNFRLLRQASPFLKSGNHSLCGRIVIAWRQQEASRWSGSSVMWRDERTDETSLPLPHFSDQTPGSHPTYSTCSMLRVIQCRSARTPRSLPLGRQEHHLHSAKCSTSRHQRAPPGVRGRLFPGVARCLAPA